MRGLAVYDHEAGYSTTLPTNGHCEGVEMGKDEQCLERHEVKRVTERVVSA